MIGALRTRTVDPCTDRYVGLTGQRPQGVEGFRMQVLRGLRF